MRRIAVINQKGGVGKTTTTVNLSAALAATGRSACVLDLDPQAHATTHLGIEPDGTSPSVYDVLVGNKPLEAVRRNVGPNLTLIPSDINLAAAEVELAGVVGREVILREALSSSGQRAVGSGQQSSSSQWRVDRGQTIPAPTVLSSVSPSDCPLPTAPSELPTDFLLMDCGPSLGVLTLNALAAADEVFIPLQPHFFALHGLSKLLETTALVSKRINPNLKVTGIVVCLYDAATKLAQEVVTDLKAFLDRSRGANVPWADAKVFDTRIRRNIKLAECPSFGKSIFGYAPNCPGAVDYAALANEVIGAVAIEPTAEPIPAKESELVAV